MEQREYVRRVLEAYRSTPGTAGVEHFPDHRHAPPLATIRSLAYFMPVIGEVPQLKAGPEYFQHLRNRIRDGRRASARIEPRHRDFSVPLPSDSSVRLPSIPQTSTERAFGADDIDYSIPQTRPDTPPTC
jgi:hypothetical protein